MPNNAQHHKSDRAGESEVDWMGERDRSSESTLSRSDWVCWNVRHKMIPRLGLLYFPVLVFMTGLASMLISLCLADHKPTGEVGPTGSDVLCFWYVVPHTILWLIVGIVTLFHVPRRVSTHWSNSPSQQLQAIFGILGGVGMTLIGAGALPSGAGFLQVFSFSCVISSVPCAVFLGVSTVVYASYSKRFRVDVASRSEL